MLSVASHGEITLSREKTSYFCQACGAAFPKWAGRCEGCGAWNTLVEETVAPPLPAGGRSTRRKGGLDLVGLAGTSDPPPRMPTGIDEFDRGLGGGLVPGSVLLIGGDPGIGKSTLTLQAAAALAMRGCRTVYVSGEESIEQIRLRARRLGLAAAPVELAAATSTAEILSSLERPGEAPAVLIIDSIQTMWVDGIESAPGSVSQLRAAAHEFVRFAKKRGTAVLLIGHVTKEGQIAGPRLLEHMVDTVLYFEGERGHQFRILRAVKNRFGPANEIGVFEMAEKGLLPVANPSALFLSQREARVSGTAVFAGIEGSRPLLLEVQALVAPTVYGTPRRAVVGWDSNRLAMLLAVLEARCGLVTGAKDVYLNVAGGFRVSEPAADLAVMAAIVSALFDSAVPPATIVFGEIGLGGEVRSVGHVAARLKEAVKLGFETCLMPPGPENDVEGMELIGMAKAADLVAWIEQGRTADGVAPLAGLPARASAGGRGTRA